MNQPCVLIIEDDRDLRETLKQTLTMNKFDCLTAASVTEGLVQLDRHSVDLILSDVQMSELSGMDLVATLAAKNSPIPIILMTAFGDVSDAVIAMQQGVRDYLVKPFETDCLIETLNRHLPTISNQTFSGDPKSHALLETAARIAQTDASVLITGESGTGKEVLAQYIHDHSARKDQPFIAINCAAIPENMLESTLFGHEKGAFTGADQTLVGKFECAQGGTLLLDEISEMALNLQAKLLRVIQEKELQRLGSNKTISLDVRLLATSNRNLPQAVSQGLFREDLYYRLNVLHISTLPLRERHQDIIDLAYHFIEVQASNLKMTPPILADAAIKQLQTYTWPGNIRELQNVIVRTVILSNRQMIDHIEFESQAPALSDQTQLNQHVQQKTFEHILKVLEDVNYNRTEAAKKLNISTRTLRYKLAKMKECGLLPKESTS